MPSSKRREPPVKIVPAEGDEPLPVEIIEQAIVDKAEDEEIKEVGNGR